jgi:hypothetical protein
MSKIYMDVDIVEEINGALECHAGDMYTRIQKIRDIANYVTVSDGWWKGTAGEYWSQSIRNWANDFDKFLEKYNILKTRLKNEWNEWGETDSKYVYDGEAIDTVQEFWDWISTGCKFGGSPTLKIDLKDIVGSVFWYWSYPPESTTTWVQDWNGRWVKIETTQADWGLDLTLSATKGVNFNFDWTGSSTELLWDMGGGIVGGAGLKLLTVGGSIGGDGVSGEASVASADVSIGVNTDEGYVGVTGGVNLGVEAGVTAGEVGLGPVEVGIESGESKDVDPVDVPPE